MAIILVFVGKPQPGAQRHLRRDNAVAAEKAMFNAEHVHRTALAAADAGGTPGQFRHHCLGIDAAGQHVAMVTIPGDDGIAAQQFGLHAHHHGLLADIEVAETADLAHAVKLARPLFKAADQHHLAIHVEQLFLRRHEPIRFARARPVGNGGRSCGLAACAASQDGHPSPLRTGRYKMSQAMATSTQMRTRTTAVSRAAGATNFSGLAPVPETAARSLHPGGPCQGFGAPARRPDQDRHRGD